MLFAVAFATIAEPQHEGQHVSIDSLYGTAGIQKAGGMQWQQATQGALLFNNDMLACGSQAYCGLRWPDSSRVFIKENSRLLINLVPDDSGQNAFGSTPVSHVTVFAGDYFFSMTVPAMVGRFHRGFLRVYTPTAVISSSGGSGTAFQVSVENQTGATCVKVIAGAVQVKNIAKSLSLFLSSPCQTYVTKESDPSDRKAVLRVDIDSLSMWVPRPIITSAMEQEIGRKKIDYYSLSGKSIDDKCIVASFVNNASYHGAWPVSATITIGLAEHLQKRLPHLRFAVVDSATKNLVATAPSDSARWFISGLIDTFDITQRAAITPRADNYREYAMAVVSIRLRLFDAATGKQLAEKICTGDATDVIGKRNTWETIGRLPFALNDRQFTASILGRALLTALEKGADTLAQYLK